MVGQSKLVECETGDQIRWPQAWIMKHSESEVDPVHLFLSLSSESEFRRKPPPIALSAVACININLW